MAYTTQSKAHSNHHITKPDGSSFSRYSRYEVGHITGKYRDMPAVLADSTGFDSLGFDSSVGSVDDNWHVVNVFDSANRYVDSMAVGGAMDSAHALQVAKSQLDSLGGVRCALVTNTAIQFDGIDNDQAWSIDAINKLMDNPSQNKNYLPVITAPELAVEAERVTFDSVKWDQNDNLISHGGKYSNLYIDLTRADTRKELVTDFDLADALFDMGAEEAGFDALMDTKQRLGLLKERLLRELVKLNTDDLKFTDATQTKEFKRQGVINIAFVFDLSDGQKLSIWFHKPLESSAKLLPSDYMVSWKWMLNKRDVTAALSPKHGDNVQLPALARRIMRLAAKNSKRFKAAQARQAKVEQELLDAENEIKEKQATISLLDIDIANLNSKIDAALNPPPTTTETTTDENGVVKTIVRDADGMIISSSIDNTNATNRRDTQGGNGLSDIDIFTDNRLQTLIDDLGLTKDGNAYTVSQDDGKVAFWIHNREGGFVAAEYSIHGVTAKVKKGVEDIDGFVAEATDLFHEYIDKIADFKANHFPVEYLGKGRYRAYKDADKKQHWTAVRTHGKSTDPFKVTANFEGGVADEDKSKVYRWTQDLIAAYPAFALISQTQFALGMAEEDWPQFKDLGDGRYRAYTDTSKRKGWLLTLSETTGNWEVEANFQEKKTSLNRKTIYTDLRDLEADYPEFYGVADLVKSKKDAASQPPVEEVETTVSVYVNSRGRVLATVKQKGGIYSIKGENFSANGKRSDAEVLRQLEVVKENNPSMKLKEGKEFFSADDTGKSYPPVERGENGTYIAYMNSKKKDSWQAIPNSDGRFTVYADNAQTRAYRTSTPKIFNSLDELLAAYPAFKGIKELYAEDQASDDDEYDEIDSSEYPQMFLDRNKDKLNILGIGDDDIHVGLEDDYENQSDYNDLYHIDSGLFARQTLNFADAVCKTVDAAISLGADAVVGDFTATAYQDSMFDGLDSKSNPTYGITVQIEKGGVYLRAEIDAYGECKILKGASGTDVITTIKHVFTDNTNEYQSALADALDIQVDDDMSTTDTHDAPKLSVGDNVVWRNDNGELRGTYRGETDGKAVLMVNGSQMEAPADEVFADDQPVEPVAEPEQTEYAKKQAEQERLNQEAKKRLNLRAGSNDKAGSNVGDIVGLDGKRSTGVWITQVGESKVHYGATYNNTQYTSDMSYDEFEAAIERAKQTAEPVAEPATSAAAKRINEIEQQMSAADFDPMTADTDELIDLVDQVEGDAELSAKLDAISTTLQQKIVAVSMKALADMAGA